jgi:SAM-dependent methyltransferase
MPGRLSFAELYEMAFGWHPGVELGVIGRLWPGIQGPSKKVCDVGAGTGRFALPLVEFGHVVTAVEPDPAMVEVLQRVFDAHGLPLDRIQPTAIEVFESKQGFDVVLLLTDVVSCLWPRFRLESALAKTRQLLQAGGLLILDCALWTDGEFERSESWETNTNSGIVRATCTASVCRLNHDAGGGFTFRLEVLTFHADEPDRLIQYSRERVMHAFRIQDLVGMVERAGFVFEAVTSLDVDSMHDNIVDFTASRAFLRFVAR